MNSNSSSSTILAVAVAVATSKLRLDQIRLDQYRWIVGSDRVNSLSVVWCSVATAATTTTATANNHPFQWFKLTAQQ